ncbi:unnamed protein product [Adineta steineri]|uniref:Uncharacterized protein n=1 Tax=Adineta steineri TaxID=433720 RepID=A0A813MZH7_9BILA|nr:unnamed protein product [Adineta steineri]
MALENRLNNIPTKSKVTAIGSNPMRRELILGFEDGNVCTYDHETGKRIHDCYKHKGWVTALSSLPAAKVFFSAGNDSTLITYNAIGGSSVIDKLNIGSVIYTITYHSRANQIIFGISQGIQIHEYNLNHITGQVISSTPLSIVCEHTDITTGVLMLDKIYSVGFDGKLILYDCLFDNIPTVSKKVLAHTAGITCLIAQKNPKDNSEWLMTGSFDKTAKVWSLDGKLLYRFTDFTQPVTGLTYVNSTKTVWIAAGLHYAYVYDPKSGEKVSSFIDTFLSIEGKEAHYFLILLRYIPELNIVIASTNIKQFNEWHYKTTGCVSCLKVKSPLENVCYTKKSPILMFTGDTEGNVFKWEQMQSNQIMYSQDHLLKLEGKKDISTYLVQAVSLGVAKTTLIKNENDKELMINPQPVVSTKRIKTVDERLPAYYVRSRSAAKISERERGVGGYISQYEHLEKKNEPKSSNHIARTASGKSILRIIFIEKLDLIIAASEDKDIYVWGFDLEALQALNTLKTESENKEEGNGTANRAVSFTLRNVFRNHTEPVTSLTLVDDVDSFGAVFLLSAGWDRRICVWDLNHFDLFTVYSDPNATNVETAETASMGYIHNMDYSPHLKYFAYAAGSDMCVYVRKFSPIGSEMTLMYELRAGIDSEVTCIKWNFITNEWVTGMDNGEFRLWGMDGTLLQAINTRGSIHAIAIDYVQKALLIANQDTLKIFDMDEYTCVQTNDGHTDVIRDVLFIPERNQYITVSLDCTMRIWNAWSRDSSQEETDIDPKKKFSDNIWEDIRKCVKNTIEVEDPNSIIDKFFQKRYEQNPSSFHEDHQQPIKNMSNAHYEAVRFSADRPYTTGGSRRPLLPIRMRRTPVPLDTKVSHRFYHPEEKLVQQVTHEHILDLGGRILIQVDINNERRIQQTYQQLVAAERLRLENEYRLKTEELMRRWQEQLDEEKLRLKKEYDEILAELERIREAKTRAEIEALIKRMREEAEQALARQWKLAQEQLALAVKQAEDRLRSILELEFLEEKERFARELIAKKDAEYAERELKALEKLRNELTKEHDQNVETIRQRHAEEVTELKNKIRLAEERYRREFSTRARLESDFRLLQTDYKRFMDNSDVFHSDYMLKLYHIGEQVGDAKFEKVLDRILTESNIQLIPAKAIKAQIRKPKQSLK